MAGPRRGRADRRAERSGLTLRHGVGYKGRISATLLLGVGCGLRLAQRGS